jgi:hypothetical protein
MLPRFGPHHQPYRMVNHAPQWHGKVELWNKVNGVWHQHTFIESSNGRFYEEGGFGPRDSGEPAHQFITHDRHGWHYVNVRDNGWMDHRGVYHQNYVLQTPTFTETHSPYQREYTPTDTEIPHPGDPIFSSDPDHSVVDTGAGFQVGHSSYDTHQAPSYDSHDSYASYDGYDTYDSYGSTDPDDDITTWQG